MSGDIVTGLRRVAQHLNRAGVDPDTQQMLYGAADEIERLRGENENIGLSCAAIDAALTEAELARDARMRERDECRILLREACRWVDEMHAMNDPLVRRWADRAARAAGGGE